MKILIESISEHNTNSRNSFRKNALAYSGSNLFVQFITFIKTLLIRRILPPEIMGFWNFVGVIQQFISTFDLGCIAGAARELPIIHGKGDQEEQTRIRSATLWFTLIQNVIIGLIASFYFFWNRENYVVWELIAASVAILIYVCLSIYTSYFTFFTGAQAFVPISKMNLIISIVELVTFPSFAYIWGLSGIMFIGLINAIIRSSLFFLAGHKIQLDVNISLYKNTIRRLMSFGFFLRLVDYPYGLFTMASILWVTKFMNIESLALFSMALGFSAQVTDISTKIGTVYSNRFFGQIGSGIFRNIINKQLKQFLLFQLLVFVPLIFWAAGVVLPLIVRTFIPKYSEANQTILVLLICSFFYVINSGLTIPWVANKKLISRGIANLAALSFMGLSLYVTWFVLNYRSIDAVAYATVAGYYLYFVYMVIAVGKDLWKLQDCIEIIFSVTIAAAWMSVILHIGNASIVKYTGFEQNLKATIIMCIWTLIAILPVPLYGLKKSQTWQMLYKGW